ncbi:MAG: preprotein translocase subunit SecY [Lachnospiraceae bacterium]|nr:preprotein translocase subunit SecY [Lachnospiraceae bacterium]
MINSIINAFKNPDIRKRLLFTILCVVIVRIGSMIPVPGIAFEQFSAWLSQANLELGFLDTLTGGSFSQMSIFALSISPYINASIIMQLLTIAIPKLEELQKDGEDGRRKIAKYTRILTIALALIEGGAMAYSFSVGNQSVINTDTFTGIMLISLGFTAGTSFLMWLGENITERGVGNGISIILLVNIVSRLPRDLDVLVTKFVTGASSVIVGIMSAIVILAVLIGMVVLIVLLQDAERRIPVQYSKKVSGRGMVGGSSSNIPLKVNTSGVIPVIFAMSLMQFPIIISSFFGSTGARTGFWNKILYMLNMQNWFNVTDWGEFKYSVGALIYIALICFFAYFYTAVTFNPIEISNNLKKSGGYCPGIRPGKPTTEYLKDILNKIIFVGAIALSIVAILPLIFTGGFRVSVGFAATSLIIVVGVILETMKSIEAMMAVHHYKGFLDK